MRAVHGDGTTANRPAGRRGLPEPPPRLCVTLPWPLAAPFPLDLIIRTPYEMKWRLEEGESFLTTVVSRGKVLYEKDDQGVGQHRSLLACYNPRS